MDDPVDAAIGWMLDTFGPWSPAVVMALTAALLVGMALSMGPPKKTAAQLEEERAELARLGFAPARR